MQRFILRAVLIGLVAGLVVGVYHNIFTVPVLERAIVLEEERAAAALAPGTVVEEEPPLVSLGMQRIGLAVGTGIMGAVLGLVFAGAYGLLRWYLPKWSPTILAIIAGTMGFWALSLLPFIKYPLVPPGVGEESTLALRQGAQTLFFIVSGLGVAGLILALNEIRNSVQAEATRRTLYLVSAGGYIVLLVAMFLVFPGNPDPVPIPGDLLFQFRAVSLVGQLLTWALITAGAVYIFSIRKTSAQN